MKNKLTMIKMKMMRKLKMKIEMKIEMTIGQKKPECQHKRSIHADSL